MVNTPYLILNILIDFALMILLCITTYFLYRMLISVHKSTLVCRMYRSVHVSESQQAVISEVIRLYFCSAFFIIVFMQFFDPDKFERYYVIPNVFCTLWILACLKWTEYVYTIDWKPVGVLSRKRKIENYVLWILLYGVIVFMLRNYILQPLPYYAILPFLGILSTVVIMKWRNVRRSTEEEMERWEKKVMKEKVDEQLSL